jgi:adenosyl cobinamide kinase/adenosyl cobinamide phosphate guanylyltransferase
MGLVLVTGGARSGKSALAVEIAAAQQRPVAFLATAQAGDAEMAARIARHRAGRPRGWRTVEEPLALESAIAAIAAGDCLLIDCLSLWAANALAAGDADGDADAVEAAGRAAAALAARRAGPTVAVTNEVGMGVVPATPLGRRYRDVLGRVNATWAAAADHALLVVCGRALVLSDAAAVVRALGR